MTETCTFVLGFILISCCPRCHNSRICYSGYVHFNSSCTQSLLQRRSWFLLHLPFSLHRQVQAQFYEVFCRWCLPVPNLNCMSAVKHREKGESHADCFKTSKICALWILYQTGPTNYVRFCLLSVIRKQRHLVMAKLFSGSTSGHQMLVDLEEELFTSGVLLPPRILRLYWDV